MVRGRERAAETGRGFFADLVDQGMRKYLLQRLFGAGRCFLCRSSACSSHFAPFDSFSPLRPSVSRPSVVSDICHCHNSIGCRPRHALGPHPIPPRDSHPHPFRGYLRLDRTRLGVERRGHYASSHRDLHRHLRGCGILPAGRVQVSFFEVVMLTYFA